MLDDFSIYFELGYDHIVAWGAIDHILFILVLAAVYQIEAWRKILVLVTAFTIGHSITLALAALEVIPFNQNLVEILIQLTILVTALFNFWEDPNTQNLKVFNRVHLFRYLLALGFGFIHGFAYSGILRSLFYGLDESIILPLFAFNVGIEVGQILVVIVFLIISYVVIKIIKVSPKYWNYFISSISAIIAIGLIIYKIGKAFA